MSRLEQAWPEYHKTNKILRWPYQKVQDDTTLQFLVTFKDRTIDEGEWIDAEQFDNTQELLEELRRERPTKDPSSDPSIPDERYTGWLAALEGELLPGGG